MNILNDILNDIQEFNIDSKHEISFNPSFMVVQPLALKGIKDGIVDELKASTVRRAKKLRKLESVLNDND